MTIAFVNNFTQASTSNGGTSAAKNASGANFFVSGVGSYVVTDTDVSDSTSASWDGSLTAAEEPINSAGRSRIWYAKNVTGNASNTFTNNVNGSYPSMCGLCFSGVDTTSPFDKQNGFAQATSATAIQPGAVVPSTNDQLIITALMIGTAGGTVNNIDSGFTMLDQITLVGATYYGSAVAYKILSGGSGVSVNPTWTMNSSCFIASTIATFKPAGAAAAFIPLIGRGPGTALAGRSGLVARAMLGARLSRGRLHDLPR